MKPVQLFDLAAAQARWLSVRQNAVAGNIANASTPDFKPTDVEPFDKVLAKTTPTLVATNTNHVGSGAFGSAIGRKEFETDVPVRPSGNAVVLEEELMKAGEVRRAFELNTAIVKAFHRMIMMTTRS
ncbi:flagellar basal body rod protein FlgB [Mesorhizobium sp. L-8-3]|uniref:flagellar basal body rod protein FlgB n=1 Tax=Mesorhizobium sp. L-8-3 TaxID=2744522 RepID=UPI0019264A56|nr:flagellar basal body rod protein FlgB [Mesorhizobium sp. L-8-3]BCH23159.1 flagellar biosynthesis protein FlgB [Mesorhizobium sp. L-8-3]